MIKVTEDMAQIFFTPEERRALRKQIEDIFCVADRSTPGMNYSLRSMTIKYSAIAELFGELRA